MHSNFPMILFFFVTYCCFHALDNDTRSISLERESRQWSDGFHLMLHLPNMPVNELLHESTRNDRHNSPDLFQFCFTQFTGVLDEKIYNLISPHKCYTNQMKPQKISTIKELSIDLFFDAKRVTLSESAEISFWCNMW